MTDEPTDKIAEIEARLNDHEEEQDDAAPLPDSSDSVGQSDDAPFPGPVEVSASGPPDTDDFAEFLAYYIGHIDKRETYLEMGREAAKQGFHRGTVSMIQDRTDAVLEGYDEVAEERDQLEAEELRQAAGADPLPGCSEEDDRSGTSDSNTYPGVEPHADDYDTKVVVIANDGRETIYDISCILLRWDGGEEFEVSAQVDGVENPDRDSTRQRVADILFRDDVGEIQLSEAIVENPAPDRQWPGGVQIHEPMQITASAPQESYTELTDRYPTW